MLGIARTFQKSELFKSMSVLENVQMGLHVRLKGNFLTTSVRLKGVQEEEKQSQEEARKILETLSLQEYENMPASVIPVAKQKLLEIGRAIASHPKLLLLDEPASGMTYSEKSNLTDLLLKIREQMHLTILIVEHDMKVVMNISDHVTVLNYGRIIAEGEPKEVRNNPLVIEAYMGKPKE
jgi:branched-chain amino acid transport system ATP-binding protein